MPDYSKGKVYKLVHKGGSDESDDMYVGSTIQALSSRFAMHRSCATRGDNRKVCQWMRDVGLENVAIVLLENTPCASKEELLQHERRWFESLTPSLNILSPYVTREERLEKYRVSARAWYAKVKDTDKYKELAEYHRRYRDEHRDALKEYKAKWDAQHRGEVAAKRRARRGTAKAAASFEGERQSSQ